MSAYDSKDNIGQPLAALRSHDAVSKYLPPLQPLSDEERIRQLQKELEQESRDYLKELSSPEYDDLVREAVGDAAPDTYACECLFLESFITDAMEPEFPVIAREFLLHEYSAIPDFYENVYASDSPKDDARCPIDFLNRKVLNLMFLAAKRGDAYAVRMFRYLYRTYYRQEYLTLKRYVRLSLADVFSVMDAIGATQGLEYEVHVVARLLIMCGFLGVTLRQDCLLLYSELSEKYAQQEKMNREWEDSSDISLEIPDELLKSCRAQVDAWIDALNDVGMDEELGFVVFTDSEELTTWKFVDCFLGDAFRYYGYPEDYVYHWGHYFHGLRAEFAKTLAILRLRFPDMEFSFRDVQMMAPFLTCVGSMTFAMDMVSRYMDALLGIGDYSFPTEDLPGADGPKFRPEGVEKTSLKGVAVDGKDGENGHPAVATYVEGVSADTEKMQKEIDTLRRKLHQLEGENRNLHELNSAVRKELSDYEDLQGRYDEACDELAALRDHVYRLTEEDIEADQPDIHEMGAAIENMHIIVIGGHENWVNKLKSRFPEWTFISTDVSGVVSSEVFYHADYIYFYTDYLSHAAYKKYIRLIRENDLRFGYIHSSNIDAVIAQIYREVQ